MKYKVSLLLIISAFLINFSFAQEKKQSKKVILSARVIDTENNPIPNATIFVDSKKANVVSDAEGKFKIRIKRKAKSISVFSIYHGITELAYNEESELTFVLSTNNNIVLDPLNEPSKEKGEMVNVGYTDVEEKNISTSVGQVSDERIAKSRHYSNIYDMIKGEVPGVVVNGNSITIRGKSSMVLSNEPLYVVNGSPTNNIADISPYDVESISILKGASAAIYGSRGTNGVILIRLKSGANK